MVGLLGSAHALDLGQPAPDVTFNGASVGGKITDLPGRFVYVDFWASWCGPCRLSFPWLGKLQSRYKTEELTVLAINLDKQRRDADRFLQQTPAAFSVAFDASGESARRFEVKTMHSSYLIGPDGKILFIHRGFTSEDAAQLDSQIDRLVRK